MSVTCPECMEKDLQMLVGVDNGKLFEVGAWCPKCEKLYRTPAPPPESRITKSAIEIIAILKTVPLDLRTDVLALACKAYIETNGTLEGR